MFESAPEAVSPRDFGSVMLTLAYTYVICYALLLLIYFFTAIKVWNGTRYRVILWLLAFLALAAIANLVGGVCCFKTDAAYRSFPG